MSDTTQINQRGFTLIELLAVMAIVSVLAGIVSVAVTGSGETGRDTQTKQDANTVETAASDFFTAQPGAEVLTPKTVDLVALGIFGVEQQTSSRWPEAYISDVFPGIFDVENLLLLNAEGELSGVTTRSLLTDFNAIDFDRLIDGEFLEVVPESAVRQGPEESVNAIWLLKKTSAAGGSSVGASRQVAVFKQISIGEIEGTTRFNVTLQELVGDFSTFTVPQLVDNGSFENGTHGGVINELVSALGTDITSWTIVSGNIDWILPLWPASEGVLSIDLNGNVQGEISQSFDTVSGRQYEVLFDMSKNPVVSSATMEVSAANTTTQYTYSTVNDLVDMLWEEKSFIFTAVDSTTTLTFQSTIIGASGPALDNVRVSAN